MQSGAVAQVMKDAHSPDSTASRLPFGPAGAGRNGRAGFHNLGYIF
jgi:hypothetical protein